MSECIIGWYFILFAIGSRLSSSLLDEVQQTSGVGTDELVGALAVLEQQEGRHGTDAKLLGGLGQVVDVKLEEVDVLELLSVRVLGQHGGNGLAGTAPLSKAVDEDNLVVGDGLLELGVAITMLVCMLRSGRTILCTRRRSQW